MIIAKEKKRIQFLETKFVETKSFDSKVIFTYFCKGNYILVKLDFFIFYTCQMCLIIIPRNWKIIHIFLKCISNLEKLENKFNLNLYV